MILIPRSKERIFQSINAAVFICIAALCAYPFYYLLLVSVSDAAAVAGGKVWLYPIGLHLRHFAAVLQLEGVSSAIGISAARTVFGTAITLGLSAMLGYICTKKQLPGRKWLYRAAVFALFLHPGLIPWFATMKYLGLQDQFLLYVLPGAISPLTVILIKTYMESLPPALEESAVVDGAGYFAVFAKVALPLCLPMIAATAVLNGVGQWNAWQDNFYLVNDPRLQTMQLTVRGILGEAGQPLPVKAAVTVLAAAPVAIACLFLQKYFAQGALLGAVKG